MLSHFDEIVCKVKDLEENAGDDYFNAFTQLEVRKKDFLVRENFVCPDIFVLVTGIARMFHLENGKEVTDYFYTPAEFIDSTFSFSQTISSEVYIQVLTDSVVYAISRDVLKHLEAEYPVLAFIERLALQGYVLWFRNHMREVRCNSVKQQYLHMLNHQNFLIQSISSKIIATFLNVSPSGLSRIKKELRVSKFDL